MNPFHTPPDSRLVPARLQPTMMAHATPAQLHTKSLPIVSWLASLALLLVAAVGCKSSSEATSSSKTTTPHETPLLQFDDGEIPAVVKGNNAGLKLVSGPKGIQGTGALEVELSSAHIFSGIVIEPSQPWDWSQQGDFSLAFDIANSGDYSIQLYLNVEDGAGNSQVRTAAIPLHRDFQTYYIILKDESLKIDSGLRDDPAPWDYDGQKFIYLWGSRYLDLSQIKKISLYIDTPLHDRRIVVDNVRLFRNPEFDGEFLTAIVDEFGQNATADFPYKVSSEKDMKRRAAAERARLAKSGPLPDRSKFGGWKNGPRLEGTGYFRTEKVDGKWTLVDPEGYLHWATGIDNARMANTTTITGVDFKEPTVRVIDPEAVTPEDSMSFLQTSAEARGTRYIASDLRHDMFTWLPGYNDPLAEHYHYKRSVHTGPVPTGESFSFYQANLHRKYGNTGNESYMDDWREVTLQRMLDWGFTSMGNWTDASFFHMDRIPYFANGWIIGDFKTVKSGFDYWSPLPDPSDPEFKRRAKVTVKAIADEVKNSPWCVGVFIDNEKGWGKKDSFESRFGLVINALKYDAAESPTKAAFTGLVRNKHETIDALNAAWETSVASWDAFAESVEVSSRNESVQEDFAMLGQAFCDEYFRTVHDELEAVLPNHLYMGVRMASWGLTPETVAAAKKYSDVISYNCYKEGLREDYWQFLAEVDMPSIIGEFHMGSTSDTGLFHPGLIVAANQEDRGRMFRDYMRSAIDNPYFVGAHWFQYIDSPLTGRAYDGENYNVGFVTVADVPYSELVDAARELNRELYPRRFGEKSAAK